MKVVKITHIEGPGDGFDMHTLGVELEGGKKVIAFAKTDTPPYKPGDEVVIEEKGRHKKFGIPKVGIKKADNKPYSPSGAGYSQRQGGSSQQKTMTLEEAKKELDEMAAIYDFICEYYQVKPDYSQFAIQRVYGLHVSGFRAPRSKSNDGFGQQEFAETNGRDEIPF